jgi:hypothetical protein
MNLPRTEPQNVYVWEGEDVTLEIAILDPSGEAVTITGASAGYAVHYPDANGRATDSVLFRKLSGAGEITIESQQVAVRIDATDTRGKAGVYPHFLSLWDAAGAQGVAVHGTLTIGRRPASGG